MAERTIYEDFAVVAEELSFTAAAARLNVAQPWLSARIRQLERRLGHPLFVRTTRRVELTEQGRVLLPKAQAIGRAMQAFASAADALGGAGSPLRLGAPVYTGRIAIARRLLDALRAQRPAIPFELDVSWTRQLLEKLARETLDAAIVLGPVDNPGFERLMLRESRLEIEMDADDPLSCGRLTPEALAGRSISVFSHATNPGLHDLLFAPLAASGAVLIATNTMWSLKDEDADDPTMLIGACSILWGKRSPRPGRLRRVVERVPAAPLYLLRRREAPSPALEVLWAAAKTL